MVAKTRASRSATAGDRDTKRLMVLGAGPAQVPGIEKAVAGGHHVITVDPYPDSPGHVRAHHYVNSDTRDQVGVLAAATELAIDGICTFRSDVAILSVNHVREHLRLPGGYPHAAEVMAHKGLFREFQRASGLPYPKFMHGAESASLYRNALSLRPAFYCKPVDNCGSRGMTRIDNDMNHSVLEAAIAHALTYSRQGSVCLEERIPGIEVGGDALFEKGEIVFIAITRKYLANLVVTGHRLPCGLPESATQCVKEALQSACEMLGYRDGPLNFDAMVDENVVTIIEMSPRNGGNGITDLIRQACAVDVERLIIDLALGAKPEPIRPITEGGFGVAILGSAEAGRIGELPTLSDWQDRCGNTVDVFYGKQEGDKVEPFVHNGNAIGYVVFSCSGPEEFARTTRELTRIDPFSVS